MKGTQAMNRSVGLVVKVRVSPADVMSAIDALDACGARAQGMSISAAVKRGMAIAFETLREGGVLPKRDGWEYTEMVSAFPGWSRGERKMKIEVGHQMVVRDQQAMAADLPIAPSMPLGHRFPEKSEEELEEMIREDMRKTREKYGLDRGDAVGAPDSDGRPGSARHAQRAPRSRNATIIREQEWKKRTDPDNWTEEEEKELQRLRGGAMED